MTTDFLWLEVTGKCQLQCSHCYNESGLAGTTGTMTFDDWRHVITDAAAAGVAMVQFIGGESTLYPGLPELIQHALDKGLGVEVFSNLVYVRRGVWEVLDQPGVSLATSYYSDDRQQHQQITGQDTLRQTTRNIREAVSRRIPIRVGIIEILDGQRVDEAVEALRRLGVQDIGIDRMRRLGRAGDGDATELCGPMQPGQDRL